MANDDDAPDPARILKLARQALTSAERRKKFRSIDFFEPYPPQLKVLCRWFEISPALDPRRQPDWQIVLLCCRARLSPHAANIRCLEPAAVQQADSRVGRRPDGAARARRSAAPALLTPGRIRHRDDSADRSRQCGRPIMVPGGTGAIDTLRVTHQTKGVVDGISSCTFKSFEMRSEKMQIGERRCDLDRRTL